MELMNVDDIREANSEEEKNKARQIIKSGGGVKLSKLFLDYTGREPEEYHLKRLRESLQFSIEIGHIDFEQAVLNCLDLDKFQ